MGYTPTPLRPASPPPPSPISIPTLLHSQQPCPHVHSLVGDTFHLQGLHDEDLRLNLTVLSVTWERNLQWGLQEWISDAVRKNLMLRATDMDLLLPNTEDSLSILFSVSLLFRLYQTSRPSNSRSCFRGHYMGMVQKKTKVAFECGVAADRIVNAIPDSIVALEREGSSVVKKTSLRGIAIDSPPSTGIPVDAPPKSVHTSTCL